MRGIGGEGDEEIGLVDEEERRQSIPGSAVSTHFPPPSSTTSSHFPGISNNSPFEPAPRRDAFESDGFPAGSQFSVPALPANNRPFYPRQMGAAALPSGEFYPVTAVNGQPIDEYEFPPRQTFGTGASSSAAVAAAGRPTYPNGTLYPGAGAPSSSGYAADLRRASWDSSAAATDARRPSWDASGAHASSVSSPASSVVGLGLTGGSGGARSVGSSAGNTTAGSSISGSMGGSGVPPGTSSPVLSTASSAEFGVDASGMAYRRSSYPHLYADPQPLTIDPPVPVPLQGIDLSGPSVDLFGLASATTGPSTENVEWLAPPSVDIYKPLASPEEEEFISWSAYS
ncbi:902_t:CDS:2 [Acaulospora colombiana]|uniref:902_t:CDS:1 n=1 Tax=Acaulospora colombiana TaxID=27376 RepID=A0ACA9LWS3_9GLOM|nr:902_t:CDS:2 [Acaulospora colombiana]